MSFKPFYFFSFTLIALFIFSCANKKNLVYFQNGSNNSSTNTFDPKLKIDDLLNITVLCADENSNKLFNHPSTISASSSSSNRGYTNGNAALSGYLIDSNGEILFPIVGKIKLDGLSRSEACKIIQETISQYIKNPIVSVQILNFKVTVLGDVKNPGTFLIPNERITLLEAIGLAGDLNITGLRNNVLIIRETNGEKKQFRVDLTKNDLFSSEIYFLTQNDVIYVEPNKSKINSSAVSTSAGIFISVASLIITTINVISK
jgi:polysaccharide export outer membrane protein